MKNSKSVILAVLLILFAGTGAFLNHLHSHQRLGRPGVKTSPSPDPKRLQVDLPVLVLDYSSQPIATDKIALEALPPDTSFGQRIYTSADGHQVAFSAVLMGGDRTSLHKPQFCLRGTGWTIDKTEERSVRVERPQPYDLPVTKLDLVPETPGSHGGAHAIYVYWFVADDEYTASHGQRMWWMARDMIRTGVLQRWAYISCLAPCAPGQEEATFERVNKLIGAAVPEFQLTPKAAGTLAASR